MLFKPVSENGVAQINRQQEKGEKRVQPCFVMPGGKGKYCQQKKAEQQIMIWRARHSWTGFQPPVNLKHCKRNGYNKQPRFQRNLKDADAANKSRIMDPDSEFLETDVPDYKNDSGK